MKIGDRVCIVKDLVGPDYNLAVGDEGFVANIIQISKTESVVLFNPEDKVEVYAVNSTSVMKIKQ